MIVIFALGWNEAVAGFRKLQQTSQQNAIVIRGIEEPREGLAFEDNHVACL